MIEKLIALLNGCAAGNWEAALWRASWQGRWRCSSPGSSFSPGGDAATRAGVGVARRFAQVAECAFPHGGDRAGGAAGHAAAASDE